MAYLVDTNLISEIRKRHPDPRVLAWWQTIDSATA
jgi:predicted nucleic acid-binding protein